MLLKTRINGGKSSLTEVANAWHQEDHDFAWSPYEEDAWAIEFAKKLNDTFRKARLAKPDPGNTH